MMKIIPFLVFFCSLSSVRGQNTAVPDTVEYARARAYANDFAEADRLLSLYTLTHNDINAYRLHAQVLYWMKAYSRAEAVYETALATYPDVPVVKLDYGRMLFELGRMKRAEDLLNDYLPHDPRHAETHMLLTYVDLWQGNSQAARNRIAQLRLWYPDNKDIETLAGTVYAQTGTTFRAGCSYRADDQPLRKVSYTLEAGRADTWWFSPVVRFRMDNFTVSTTTYTTQWLQAGNTVTLGRMGLTVQGSAGLFTARYPGKKNGTGAGDQAVSELTGSLQVTQKLTPSLFLELGGDRQPYQYTIASIQTPLLPYVAQASLRLNKADAWLGKAGYEVQQFRRTGRVTTAYGWLLAPLLTTKRVDLKAGYAITYTDADRSTFVPALSLNSILTNYRPDTPIRGVYDPYFSPANQLVNALLASARLRVVKGVELSAKANAGIWASAGNAYLYLDNGPGNTVVLNRDFGTMRYHPVVLEGDLRVTCSRHISLQASYTYSSLFFYKSHQASVDLKYHW
ncbi:hypothetical protein GCM10023189_51620 [Nibrella saemangeumensis]|uniref:Tetratricopeptide repeat protein n=1 Tax=Nibrella saemangeumensis TaxID=1084526 RepID=A0ABP8NII9_9BACT